MIFDATKCTLGEGPLWHPLRKQLFWFDILGMRLHTRGQHWDLDTYVSAAGWVDHDTLVIASAKGLHRFDITTGEQSLLCGLEADNAGTRSNDGRADPQGGFWIGTMGLNAEPAQVPSTAITRASCANFTATCKSPIPSALHPLAIPPISPTQTRRWSWPFHSTQTDGQMMIHNCTSICAALTSALTAQSATQTATSFPAQWGVGRVAAYDPKGQFIEAFNMPRNPILLPRIRR